MNEKLNVETRTAAAKSPLNNDIAEGHNKVLRLSVKL